MYVGVLSKNNAYTATLIHPVLKENIKILWKRRRIINQTVFSFWVLSNLSQLCKVPQVARFNVHIPSAFLIIGLITCLLFSDRYSPVYLDTLKVLTSCITCTHTSPHSIPQTCWWSWLYFCFPSEREGYALLHAPLCFLLNWQNSL